MSNFNQSGNHDLQYIIENLHNLKVRLGGETEEEKKLRNDEFLRGEKKIHDSLSTQRKKQDERNKLLINDNQKGDNTNRIKAIKLSNDIKKLMEQIDKDLNEVDKIFDYQFKKKDSDKKLMERKNNIRIQLKLMLEMFKEKESEVKSLKKNKKQIKSLDISYNNMLNIDDDEGYKVLLDDSNEQLNKDLEMWKNKDLEIDNKLHEICNGLDDMEIQLDDMHEGVRQGDQLMAELKTDIQKVDKNIEINNNSLKTVLEKYRKPEKLCLDIILIIQILILIGIMIKVAT